MDESVNKSRLEWPDNITNSVDLTCHPSLPGHTRVSEINTVFEPMDIPPYCVLSVVLLCTLMAVALCTLILVLFGVVLVRLLCVLFAVLLCVLMPLVDVLSLLML